MAVDVTACLTWEGLSLLKRVILGALGGTLTLFFALLSLFLKSLLLCHIDVGPEVAEKRLVDLRVSN